MNVMIYNNAMRSIRTKKCDLKKNTFKIDASIELSERMN